MVVGIADAFEFNFFPSLQRLFHENLGSEGEGTLGEFDEPFLVRADTRTETTQGIGRADHHRETDFAGGLQGVVHVLDGMAHGRLQFHLVELLHEEVAVLGIHDSLNRSTQDLYAIFLQRAVQIEFRSAVERRLATESQQNAVRAFLFNDFGHEMGSDRLEIHLVGNALGSLDGCDVGIHEH